MIARILGGLLRLPDAPLGGEVVDCFLAGRFLNGYIVFPAYNDN